MRLNRPFFAAAVCCASTCAPALAVKLNVGDLILADEPSGSLQPSRILRFDPSTGAHDVISSGGVLSSIQHVALDRKGRILVTDSFAGVIRIDPASGIQTVLSGNFFNEGYQFPGGFVELSSGDLVVTTSNRHILRIDCTTGAKTVLTQASVAVESMAWHDGHLLITSPSGITLALLRFDPVTWTHAVVSSGGFFRTPRDMALAESGYAFIADTGGILVGVDPVTGMQTSASAGGPLNSLHAVTIGGKGRPIVTTRAGQIFEIDPDNFGEQILLTAPGENLGELRAIEYVSVVPAPGGAGLLLAGLALVNRRTRSSQHSIASIRHMQ